MTQANTGTGNTETGDMLVLTRVFDAPRDLVYKAWTEAERLAQWWGPKGMTISVHRFELRPGGEFLYSLQSPDGQQMWGKFVYREVAPPERLVYVSSFSDPEGNVTRAPFGPDMPFPLEIMNTLTLTEENGKTTLTLRGGPLNASEQEQAFFQGMTSSMEEGFAGTFEQLDAYLASARGG